MHRHSVVRRRDRATQVTGAPGQVAATTASKTVTLVRFVKRHTKSLKRSAREWFWAPLQYMGWAETDEQAQNRREDEVRWRRLKHRLIQLHRDNGVLECPTLPAAYCPITQEPMTDPVVAPEGQSFERAAIVLWLQHNQTNPMTRTPLTPDQLAPNVALRQTIEQVRTTTRELARLAALQAS